MSTLATLEGPPQLNGIFHVEQVMGMPVSIDIREPGVEFDPALGARLRQAVSAVVSWLHEVDATWSTWKDDSMITRFARGEIKPDDLPEAMHEVLDRCEWWNSQSGGIFDIHIPAPNGTNLETSGYIKGWAVQTAADLLDKLGFKNFSINAGGDIAIRGQASPDAPWKIGLRHPAHADAFHSIVELKGSMAIATSGLYERGNHIVDTRIPDNGVDSSPAVCSATVIGTNLADVDVAATVLFVLGVDGLEWIEANDMEAMVMTNGRDMHVTSGFAQHLAAVCK